MTKQLLPLLFSATVLLNTLAAQTPGIFIELSKMDVLYVGVDNPIQVSQEDTSSAELRLQANRGTLTKVAKGRYILNVNTPGPLVLSALTDDNQRILSKTYRVHPVPDPVPGLGLTLIPSDSIPVEVFKAQQGILAELVDFDFEAKCGITRYTITHIGRDPLSGELIARSLKNFGPRYESDSFELVNAATVGDTFIFSNIEGRCMGDTRDRTLPPLVFHLVDKE